MFVCRADELLNPLKYIASISDEAIFKINTPDHINEWYIGFMNPERTIGGYGQLNYMSFIEYDGPEMEIGLNVARFSKFLPMYGKEVVTIEFIAGKVKVHSHEPYGAKLEYIQSLISTDIRAKPVDLKRLDERFSHTIDFDLKYNIL
jgi:hypothetical protein